MSRRDVTVVIPTKDRWALLRGTLASVLAQRDVDLDVVVVDDGSTTSSGRDASELDDPRVRVVRHERSHGVAAARNRGLAEAAAAWVAFVDDDDLWAPDKLRAQLDALAAVPGARWSCVGEVHVDGALATIGYDTPPPSGDVAPLLLATNRVPGGGSGVLADAELVREVGGFDERLRNLADYDLWIRLALAARVATVDRPLLAYRIHGGGLSRQLVDVLDEHDHVVGKYAAARAARGVELVPEIHFWVADRLERSGRRAAALRSYVRAGWARAWPRIVMLPVPGVVGARDRRRARRPLPAGWDRADLAWLDDLRVAGSGRDRRPEVDPLPFEAGKARNEGNP